MPTTRGIYYPATSTVDGYVTDVAAVATSITATRSQMHFTWADSTARTAATGMIIDDCGYQTDTGITYRYNGSAWKAWESDWITYTPTLAGITIGTGGSAASAWSYKYVLGDIRVKGGAILGSSGGAVTGVPTITIPANRVALVHPYEATAGGAVLYDTSTTTPYLVTVGTDNTNVDKVRLYPHNSGAVVSAISATVPFTWAAGDAITVDFTYRPA